MRDNLFGIICVIVIIVVMLYCLRGIAGMPAGLFLFRI